MSLFALHEERTVRINLTKAYSNSDVLGEIYRQAGERCRNRKKALEAEPVRSASIKKHLNAAAPYIGGKLNLDILLRKNAHQRKEPIDRAVFTFRNGLAANKETVAREVQDNGNKDPKKLLDSMSERASNLENAIADINDQRNKFASLCAETANRMRVGTNTTTVQPYVSEQSRVPGWREGANSEGRLEIGSAATPSPT